MTRCVGGVRCEAKSYRREGAHGADQSDVCVKIVDSKTAYHSRYRKHTVFFLRVGQLNLNPPIEVDSTDTLSV